MTASKLTLRSRFAFLACIVLPVFLTVAVTIGIVFLALQRMGDAVSAIDTNYARQTVQGALDRLLEDLKTAQTDYAIWDDAAENLYGVPDPEFVNENFRDSTEEGEPFDAALVVDQEGRTVLAFRDGARVEAGASEIFGPEVAALVTGMARASGGTVGPVGTFARTPLGPAAVALGPVLPYDQSIALPEGEKRTLVIARVLTVDRVAALGRDQTIADLKFAGSGGAEASTGGPGLDLTGPGDVFVGRLVWTPRDPGAAAFAEAARLTTSVSAVLVLLVGLLLFGIERMLRTIRKGEDKARHDALHDTLTGLPNRAAFNATIEARGKGGRREPASVLFVDLDGFKDVNDTYGHEIGDRLLKAVSSGFASIIGGRGTLARLGGDEFGLILPGATSDVDGYRLADAMIRIAAEPMDFDGRTVQVGASIGLASDLSSDLDGAELVRRADVAMYAAKESGKNRVERYHPGLDDERNARAETAVALRHAVETGGLSLAYQPVVDARSGATVSVEALVRWNRADGGPVAPAVFIPIAEEAGIIGPLGEWVLRRVCRDAARWPGLKVSVNVSPVQFRDPTFDKLIGRILAEERFDPKRLELEITESYLISHPERAQKTIDALRAIGVTVSLDDFGTGFSSVSSLKRFAFDKLKLDRSVIQAVATDTAAQKMVHATVALAEALGIRVTAEGVEGEDEALLLRLAGCQEMQGFHFARPKPAEEIDALLSGGKLRVVA